MQQKCIAILVVLATVMTCAPLASSSDEAIDKVDLPGIVNFSKISGSIGYAGPIVAFGGETQPSAMKSLKAQGMATVINLRLATEEGVDLEVSRTAARAVGLKYIHLPFDAEQPGPTVVDDFLQVVGDPGNQPVYIHCNSATRVAALWLIGRVVEDGLTFEEASEEAEVIAEKPSEAIAFASGYIDSDE